MKNIKILVFAVFLSGFMAMPFVYAQQDAPKPEGMHKRHHDMLQQLNLTDDQKKQLEANKEKQKQQMKVVFQQMRSQREAMQQELMKKDLDMAAINNTQAQIKALQAQMVDNRLNSILEVRKILTPDQFAKFLSLMEKHHSKERGSKGKGLHRQDGFSQDEKPE